MPVVRDLLQLDGHARSPLLEGNTMTMKVCAEPGCPNLVSMPTSAGYRCPEHARARDRQRGTRQQRGYDAAHDKERAALAPTIALGRTRCARCGHLIRSGEPWHLDHTDDRAGYLGASHERCNTAAGGRAAHRG